MTTALILRNRHSWVNASEYLCIYALRRSVACASALLTSTYHATLHLEWETSASQQLIACLVMMRLGAGCHPYVVI